MKVELLAYTPDPEKMVALAAKLCYSNSGIDDLMQSLTIEKIDSFVKMLESYSHFSPFEHISFSFGVEGVSRNLTHQLVRHRIASYSQKSQRYVKEGSFEFVIPPQIKNSEFKNVNRSFLKAMESAQDYYDEIAYGLISENILKLNGCKFNQDGSLSVPGDLMKLGNTIEEVIEKLIKNMKLENKKKYSSIEKRAIEDARYVLPSACETKIIVTMNARTLLTFFEHRLCNRAQWEIREMAELMLNLVKPIAPNIFKNAGPSCINGVCKEGKMTCGKALEMKNKFLGK